MPFNLEGRVALLWCPIAVVASATWIPGTAASQGRIAVQRQERRPGAAWPFGMARPLAVLKKIFELRWLTTSLVGSFVGTGR
jgi:hypothetical protein